MSEPSFRPVGERLAGGDERALEECYHLYGQSVRSYLRRFVPPGRCGPLPAPNGTSSPRRGRAAPLTLLPMGLRTGRRPPLTG